MEETNSIHSLIETSKEIQLAIKELEQQLTTFTTPKFTDTSLLPSIYSTIQDQMPDTRLRDQRLTFVFIAVYLYSPATIYDNHPLKAGLRSKIGSAIGRSKGEVSSLITESKFRYDHLAGFREKTEAAILPFAI